ncbi:response regulator [Bacillus taeanensis]|uniref:Two-component system response regulator DcuR n=1 Tax=Bacillus taeanensis TaxID=273032 RepID=A0A366Y1A8_9BACI|nr:response regulator [Bacillus taeanensis]RBW71155.1 two-component system response regulator DcuR [Bacillus taeanensis]
MIRVLIVEDDPMVAEFNKRYLEEIDGFLLAGIVHSVHDALQVINEQEIDLILLDVYMPGKNGLELLASIREQEKEIDVILITAASDVDKVQTALRYGAVDYLIKPFEFDRFYQALNSYKEKYYFFNKQKQVKQEDIDQKLLRKDKKTPLESVNTLPKGLTKSTLKVVVNVIAAIDKPLFSTEEIAEQADISRVSVRKYLKFLTDINVLEETLTYGIGRPVYLYTYNQSQYSTLKKYL